jgi:hypothetical protein
MPAYSMGLWEGVKLMDPAALSSVSRAEPTPVGHSPASKMRKPAAASSRMAASMNSTPM